MTVNSQLHALSATVDAGGGLTTRSGHERGTELTPWLRALERSSMLPRALLVQLDPGR